MDAPGPAPAGRPPDPERPGFAALGRAVRNWIGRFWGTDTPIVLSMQDLGEELLLVDNRPGSPSLTYRRSGAARRVLLACDEPRSLASLARELKVSPDDPELRRTLATLQEDRLLLPVSGRLLALPVHGDVPALTSRNEFPTGLVVHSPAWKRLPVASSTK